MAHIEDRWHRTIKGPDDGTTTKERTARYGIGLRWRARYITPDGDQRNRSFATKVLAEKFLTEIEHSKISGTYRDPDAGKVTLRKYAAGWVKAYPEDSSRGEKIRGHLRLHILPVLGSVTLGELDRRPSRVQQFMAKLPLGSGGASQVGITLSMILRAAVDDGIMSRNPFTTQSVAMPKPPRRKIRPWTPAQIEEIRTGLPARWQAVTDCGGGLGMRQGEIFAIGPDEIDFLRRKVYVLRQIKRVDGRAWFAAPKGGREREIPLPERVALRLAAHIETYDPLEVTLPWNEPGNPRRHGKTVTAALMFTRDGAAIHPATFYTTVWRAARDAAGITEGGMHQMRHLYASALLAGGVDIRALAEYLGHHDPAVTLRIYAHLMPSAEGRALRAVEAAFASEAGIVSPKGIAQDS